MSAMAVEAKKLDVLVGNVAECARWGHGAVPDKLGGAALAPLIAVSSRGLHERHGTRPAPPEELEGLVWDLPPEGDG
jgi:hypothetical protein